MVNSLLYRGVLLNQGCFQEGSGPAAASLLIFLLGLTLDAKGRHGSRAQSVEADWPAAFLATSVAALFNAHQRLINFRE